jgi:ribosomal-protein-alanine N-acetyltransferase
MEDLEPLFLMDQICFPPGIAFTREDFSFFLRQPGSIARICEEAGKIAGFVLACAESRFSAHVITLDVMPERRRAGVGMELMLDLHRELEMRKIRKSILEVGVGNTPARCLYRKLGYARIDKLAGYYRGKEDAYRMMLILNRQKERD